MSEHKILGTAGYGRFRTTRRKCLLTRRGAALCAGVRDGGRRRGGAFTAGSGASYGGFGIDPP
jgi:hypothetical protein